MDTGAHSIDESASVQRCYRYFRTMGLRHLIVVNYEHAVVGMVTRVDLIEERLEHHDYDEEGQNFQKYVAIDESKPLMVYETDNMVLMSSGASGAKYKESMNNSDVETGFSKIGARIDDGSQARFNPMTVNTQTISDIPATFHSNRSTSTGVSLSPIPSPAPQFTPSAPAPRPAAGPEKAAREPKSTQQW
jgi:hypothetical protein